MIPPYESILEGIYRSLLKEGDIAIDIGAHVGRHTVPMAKAVGPSGKILAFEPMPLPFAALSAAVTAAGLDRIVELHNVALGDRTGQAEFTYVPDFPEYSGFKERRYHADTLTRHKVQVEVERLDAYLPKLNAVRFIKIDAEGGELTILRGACELIEALRPVISFEAGDSALIHYAYTAADYYDFFESRQYGIYSIFGLPVDKASFVDLSAQQFLWDYIAVPKSESWRVDHGPVRALLAGLGSGSGADSKENAVLLATALAERDAAQAAHRQVLASTSWRVTGPLRGLARLLRKRR